MMMTYLSGGGLPGGPVRVGVGPHQSLRDEPRHGDFVVGSPVVSAAVNRAHCRVVSRSCMPAAQDPAR
jgi:hypothetical protein